MPIAIRIPHVPLPACSPTRFYRSRCNFLAPAIAQNVASSLMSQSNTWTRGGWASKMQRFLCFHSSQITSTTKELKHFLLSTLTLLQAYRHQSWRKVSCTVDAIYPGQSIVVHGTKLLLQRHKRSIYAGCPQRLGRKRGIDPGVAILGVLVCRLSNNGSRLLDKQT